MAKSFEKDSKGSERLEIGRPKPKHPSKVPPYFRDFAASMTIVCTLQKHDCLSSLELPTPTCVTLDLQQHTEVRLQHTLSPAYRAA